MAVTSMLRTRVATASRAAHIRPTLAAPRSLAVRSASTVAPLSEVNQVVPTQEEIEKDPQLAGLGYPQIPQVSRQLRPAKAGWWDEQERIQFNEVLPENDDTLSMWAPDVHKVPADRALGHLSIAAGCIALFATLVYAINPERPAVKRQYPYDGLVRELSGTYDQTYAVKEESKGSDEEEEE